MPAQIGLPGAISLFRSISMMRVSNPYLATNFRPDPRRGSGCTLEFTTQEAVAQERWLLEVGARRSL